MVLSVGRSSGGDRNANVDHMSITVYYTPDTVAPISSITAPLNDSLLS